MEMNYRKCSLCNGPWVCWNWVVDNTDAVHECWDCDSCFTTKKPVTDGIPYEELLATYPEENKLRGQIKNINELLVHWCEGLSNNPEEEAHYLRLIKEHTIIKKDVINQLRNLLEKT